MKEIIKLRLRLRPVREQYKLNLNIRETGSLLN